MDIVQYYNELSKEETLKLDEVKEYSDNLNNEITRINNLKCNKNIFMKIMHPVSAISSSIKLKRLNREKKEFLHYLNTDILLYDHSEFSDLISSLECTAKYYKPVAIREYVKEKTRKKK